MVFKGGVRCVSHYRQKHAIPVAFGVREAAVIVNKPQPVVSWGDMIGAGKILVPRSGVAVVV